MTNNCVFWKKFQAVFWFISQLIFFFFWLQGFRGFSSLTRDEPGPKQWKHWVLITGLPGNSLLANLCVRECVCVCVCMCVYACAPLCLTLCDPIDWSPAGTSVHGISQARKLEWVAISSSRGPFVTLGSNFHFLPWQVDSWPLRHPTPSFKSWLKLAFQTNPKSHKSNQMWIKVQPRKGLEAAIKLM